MFVHNDFAGSVVVVQLDKKFNHYIDVKRDVRQPGTVFLEAVKGGQVYARDCCLFPKAPEAILKLVRQGTHG
jgi:hypothetical protein